jgi:5-formyltetrahydrofolate cyclo-ligase
MNSVVAEEKRLIRAAIRARLQNVTPQTRREHSRLAVVRLLSQETFRQAQIILAFMPLPDELDIFPALEWAWAAGKTVAIPRYDPATGAYCAAQADPSIQRQARGPFGVLEPPASAPVIPLNLLDFVLVPGVAFDRGGRRLGRGRGFYDRLLAGVCAPKCGVALDEQITDGIPAEPHDIAMNFILTPTRWLAVADSNAAGN